MHSLELECDQVKLPVSVLNTSIFLGGGRRHSPNTFNSPGLGEAYFAFPDDPSRRSGSLSTIANTKASVLASRRTCRHHTHWLWPWTQDFIPSPSVTPLSLFLAKVPTLPRKLEVTLDTSLPHHHVSLPPIQSITKLTFYLLNLFQTHPLFSSGWYISSGYF